MINDYEDYEEWEQQALKENEKYLALFEKSMSKLSEKTVRNHLQNVDLFINDFLINYEGVEPREGITKIHTFISEFFIRKCMWSTPTSVKTTVTSLKKFYKFLKDNGQIEKSEYDSLCEEIKANQESWQEECRRYNEFDEDDFIYDNMFSDDFVEEASMDQWKELYNLTDELHALEPWKHFSDRDLICVNDGLLDTYYNILGNAGLTYGIVVYEDDEGLNDYMLAANSSSLNVSNAYAMNRQTATALYWGNKEELSEEAAAILSYLGRSYEGKDQWPYFLSFEPGYIPSILNAEDADAMIEYLSDLIMALKAYQAKPVKVDYEKGKMLLCKISLAKTTCECMEADLPFIGINVPSLHLENFSLYKNLKKLPKSQAVLELDVWPSGIAINDPQYIKPANAVFSMICEAKSGLIIAVELSAPDEDPHIKLVEALVAYMEEHGLPKEIRVTHVLMEAVFKELADECKIKLRKVKKLPKIEEATRGMKDALTSGMFG